MKKTIISLLIVLSGATLGFSQIISGGFKVGANYSNILGPSEMNDGKALETNEFDSGFHIGAIVNFRLSDVLGARTELLYSQKGMEYTFEGPSYWFFYPNADNTIKSLNGKKTTRLFVSNSYIDIPLMLYGKLGKLELSGGVNVGFLVSSKATGEIKYSTLTIDEFTTALNFNYNKDKITRELLPGQPQQTVRVNGIDILTPSAIGAYHAALGQTDKRYNGIDLGLNAGISYFFNKGLFLGLRANYGLSDVTKNDQDFSATEYDDNADAFISRDDVDRNVYFQLSIGFSM